MTNLIVRPIDPSEKGSYRKRREFLAALADAEKYQKPAEGEKSTPAEMLAQLDAFEKLVRPFLATDDDTSIEDALAELSEDEFFSLPNLIAGTETVNPPTAGESPNGSLEKEPALPAGQ